MKKTIIGITGKLASGKTYAGHFFEKLGGLSIDCDEIVRNLYKKGEIGAKKIETFFGEEFMKNEAVNKTKLGTFVSKDVKKLRILEKIIHPVVLSEVQKAIDKSQKQIIFIEISAPTEKFLDLCDKIILIKAQDSKRKIPTKYLERIDKFKQLDKIKPDFTIKNNFNKKDFESALRKTYNVIVGTKT